jgi:adenylate cyclase
VSQTRRLAAIMFTDMVGYTALTQSDESKALKLLERHNQLLRPIFPRFNGREVKTVGDSFLVEFDSALEATLCAIEIQRSLHEYDLSAPVGSKIQIRVGIHLGDVVHAESDVFGDAVNIAARLEPLAEPGSVCISEQVFAQVRNKIPNPLRQLEPTVLKNVRFPMNIYRIVLPWEGHENDGPATGPKELRIVVLPFVNLSPNPVDGYFASGITEELISSVSRIRELSVISRTSAMRYSGGSKPLKEIGEELRVGYALEGSVRKAGDTVRISVQLIDVGEDRHLWAESYDRTLENVFAVQTDVATQVARALKSTLLPGTKDRIERMSPRTTEAYLLYLQGRARMPRAHLKSWEAIQDFEQALEIDPNYALACAALAECYTYLAGETLSESEAFPKATEFAKRALEIDPELSEAHASLGIVVLQRDLDVQTAESELRKALALNPNNSVAHMWLGACLSVRGLGEESIAEERIAEGLDPLSAFVKWFLAYILASERKYDEAKTKCLESAKLDPMGPYPHAFLSVIYRFQSEYDSAISAGLKALELEPDFPFALEALGCAYALTGRIKEAREMIDKLQQFERRGFQIRAERAIVELTLGNREEAIQLFEQADRENDAVLLLRYRLGVLDSVRSDPRMVRIARRRGWAIRDAG